MSTLVLDLSSWKPESYIFWQYYWSPGRFGYDAIVSNGRFYEYSAIRSTGFTTYTEPILKDGLTYKKHRLMPLNGLIIIRVFFMMKSADVFWESRRIHGF